MHGELDLISKVQDGISNLASVKREKGSEAFAASRVWEDSKKERKRRSKGSQQERLKISSLAERVQAGKRDRDAERGRDEKSEKKYAPLLEGMGWP